jgi:hypothetical protein
MTPNQPGQQSFSLLQSLSFDRRVLQDALRAMVPDSLKF